MNFDFSGKLAAGLERGRRMFGLVENADPKCAGCGSSSTKAISPLSACDGCGERFCADCLDEGECSQCRIKKNDSDLIESSYPHDVFNTKSEGLVRGRAKFSLDNGTGHAFAGTTPGGTVRVTCPRDGKIYEIRDAWTGRNWCRGCETEVPYSEVIPK